MSLLSITFERSREDSKGYAIRQGNQVYESDIEILKNIYKDFQHRSFKLKEVRAYISGFKKSSKPSQVVKALADQGCLEKKTFGTYAITEEGECIANEQAG